ncbi:MAG TPA: hypothetical protein VJM31_12695 [Vicinamibacterales bacterium]|nr:hypothetical protein [Vicinamibacterales bacterium]
MWGTQTVRYDSVQVQDAASQWTTLTPADFLKLPLVQRIQLISGRKLRFLLAGAEVSPVDALKD